MSSRRCTSYVPSTMISLSRVRTMKTSRNLRMHWRCMSHLTRSSVSQPGDVHAVTTVQTVCVKLCCEHVLLICATFDTTVQVPTNWVAETLELCKKTDCLLGTAGPRRAATISAMAKDKDNSVLKLSYLDQSIVPKSPVKSAVKTR
jgi:hypothetical protein